MGFNRGFLAFGFVARLLVACDRFLTFPLLVASRGEVSVSVEVTGGQEILAPDAKVSESSSSTEPGKSSKLISDSFAGGVTSAGEGHSTGGATFFGGAPNRSSPAGHPWKAVWQHPG